MESILTSIKKLLGIQEEYTHFDSDIITYINSVFSILQQLGIGPETGFAIIDDTATWEDFMGSDNRLEFVKSFVCLKVKLLFDPPSTTAVMDSMGRMLDEFVWRLTVVDNFNNT